MATCIASKIFTTFETLGLEDVFAKPAIVILEWSENFPLKAALAAGSAALTARGGEARLYYPPLICSIATGPLTLSPRLYSRFLAGAGAAVTLESGTARRPNGECTRRILAVTNPGRIELKSYRVTLPMGTLSIGVDNIHHDVFLSPKFVQATRDYLFDLIRQNTSTTYLSGIEFRSSKPVDSTTFRKLLTEMLQSSLTSAKHQKNIEIDLLFRMAILKFLTGELLNQFANVILDGKEYIRKRGEFFERCQQAHVIKARLVGDAVGTA